MTHAPRGPGTRVLLAWLALVVGAAVALVEAHLPEALGLALVGFGVAWVGAGFLRHRRGAGALPLVACLGAGLLLLAAAEVRLRWGGAPVSTVLWPIFRLDDALGWALEPGVETPRRGSLAHDYRVRTDALGTRNHMPYPGDGTLPVMVQGDSEVFGLRLADPHTLPMRLNLGLRRRHPSRYGPTHFEFFNFGVPGYDPHHYVLQFEALRRRFRVGRRLVVLNAGNDLTMAALVSPYALPRPWLRPASGGGYEVVPAQAPLPFQAWDFRFQPPWAAHDPAIHEHARAWGRYLPAPLRSSFLARHLARHVGPNACGPCRARGGGPLPTLDVHHPDWMLLRPEHWPEPFRTSRLEFPRLLGWLAAQDPPPVICLLPTRAQVVDAVFAEAAAGLRAAGHSEADLDRFAMLRVMGDAARAQGLAVIDPTPALRAAPAPAALFQPRPDEHYAAAGHRVLAEAILDAWGEGR